jgi:hypothetical protein
MADSLLPVMWVIVLRITFASIATQNIFRRERLVLMGILCTWSALSVDRCHVHRTKIPELALNNNHLLTKTFKIFDKQHKTQNWSIYLEHTTQLSFRLLSYGGQDISVVSLFIHQYKVSPLKGTTKPIRKVNPVVVRNGSDSYLVPRHEV